MTQTSHFTNSGRLSVFTTNIEPSISTRCECIDWDMIKLFYALLMLFFCAVGMTCFLYLFYVFNFNENLWYFYFPVGKRYRERF